MPQLSLLHESQTPLAQNTLVIHTIEMYMADMYGLQALLGTLGLIGSYSIHLYIIIVAIATTALCGLIRKAMPTVKKATMIKL